MGISGSRAAIVCALGLGFLISPSTVAGDDDRRRRPVFRSAQGQEVVAGSYSCDGTIFTDEQATNASAGAFFNATSGITSGFFGTQQRTEDVPDDFEALARICEAHIGRVLAEVPGVCVTGPVESGQGEFGNGARVFSSFDFSCQGTRDQVIGVIGGFSRLSLTARLP